MHLPAASGPARTAPGATSALALLLGINLFNYIDRQVLSAVLPRMQLDTTLFDPADPWLQTKAGALTTAFMVTYMLLSPVFGRLGDRMRRWVIVGLAVVVWSLASGSSGLAWGYVALFLTRCVVGIGEAAYGPIAPAMIADLYPASKRGQVIAWFYVAIPVGSALGFVIGGQVAEWFGDWRHSFYVTYAGVLLGLACFAMREPPRPAAAADGPAESYFDVLRWLCRVPSFRYLTTGMTCTTFLLGGAAVFLPVYIFQREARFDLTPAAVQKLAELKTADGREVVPAEVRAKLLAAPTGGAVEYRPFVEHLSQTLTRPELDQYGSRVYDAATAPGSVTNGRVTFVFGALLVVTGLVATLLGGWVGDKLRDRGLGGAYFQAAGWTTLLGWPCFVAVLYAPFPLAWVFVAGALFFLFFNTGPANTILANISSSATRATCFAINILVIHALGDAISPTLIGLVADFTSLHTALLLASGFILLGGVLWVLGARHLDADTEAAANLDAQNPPAG
jgi:MFS family permease